jgi:hypothetical protein
MKKHISCNESECSYIRFYNLYILELCYNYSQILLSKILSMKKNKLFHTKLLGFYRHHYALGIFIGCLTATNTLPTSSVAQNTTYQYGKVENVSIDYMQNAGSQYLLLGKYRPATISVTDPSYAGTYANNGPFSNLNRIHLQTVNATNLWSIATKTYVTVDELTASCSGLSVEFHPTDAKETADGGFIICGNVHRDGETTTCSNLPAYHKAFLLKLDASGNVQAYKTYGEGEVYFNSVMDVAGSNTVVVCGNVGGSPGDAVALCADYSTLNTIWTHRNAPTECTGVNPMSSSFTEVTSYYDISSGNTYCALTGPTVIHQPLLGGAMVTIIDPSNGNIIKNAVITAFPTSPSPYNPFSPTTIGATGISDAHDGDLIITGESFEHGTTLEYSPYIVKFDPNGLPDDPGCGTFPNNTLKFMYEYRIAGSHVFPTSIVRDNSTDIYVTGHHFSSDDAFLLKVDAFGNFLRFDQQIVWGDQGKGVIWDPSGHASYSCNTGETTYVIKDNHSYNECADVIPVPVTSKPVSVYAINDTPWNVQEYTESIIPVDIVTLYGKVCGSYFKTTDVKQLEDLGEITLFPNPVSNVLNIALPSNTNASSIRIFDVTGRTVISKSIADSQGLLSIDVSSLEAGMYIFSCDGNNSTNRQVRFIKQ